MNESLKAPFPWFGGKRAAADEAWRRFGAVDNYVEPFCGSCAVLLGNPEPPAIETVNDVNCWLANFWRALKADPDGVAEHADWPVNECDLKARGDWLFYREGIEEWTGMVRADPEWYDVKSAGWWVWGQSSWIGGGWGGREKIEGKPHLHRPQGVNRQVHRKRPSLGNAGRGVHRKIPHLGDAGRGVKRQIPHLGNAGRGVHSQSAQSGLLEYLRALSSRLRRVRVCCGDWRRVLTPVVTHSHGMTAVFLDPPYAADRDKRLYGADDSLLIGPKAVEWAVTAGVRPDMRIAYCGYQGEGDALIAAGWSEWRWKAHGGYGNQSKTGNVNNGLETVWFSPACLKERHPAFI